LTTTPMIPMLLVLKSVTRRSCHFPARLIMTILLLIWRQLPKLL